ncbi:MAG: FAD-binding oxidoreductase [Isosphaeraceae bacterium]|nr:FAD-binding oxidoreductase [Isosphaeraceae bacterium]
MDSASLTLGDGVSALRGERPTSVEELQDLVRRCASESTPIYPQGGRTSLDYGGVPRSPGVAVSLAGLDRVIDYPAADMTITVEAGITLGELSAILDREGQRLTIDAPRCGEATLGGVYATNSTGPRRYGCGRPRDQIIGVGFVDVKGDRLKGGGRVVKNVAGYDFPRMMTGSMGTLGVITDMTLKVRPKPEASTLVWASVTDIDRVATLLDELNLSATRPTAIELLNRPAAEEIASGIDVPKSSDWVIVLGFEDNAASVEWQVRTALEEFVGLEATRPPAEAVDRLWSALVEYRGRDGIGFSFEAHLPPMHTAAFAAEVPPALWSLQSHAGTGIVRGVYRLDLDIDDARAEIHRLRSLAVGFGGGMVLPHCPSAWKADLEVWGYRRPDWVWCERLKQTFDPGGLLNPGRFVGKI